MKSLLLNPITLSVLGLATLPIAIAAVVALYATCAVCAPFEKEMELNLEDYA